MPYIQQYAPYVIIGMSFFSFSSFLQTFVRNDGAPKLAMIAVITGGILNIILDILFVFPMQMGMKGAAIATVIGSLTTSLVLITHFINKENRVKICIKGISFDMIMKIISCGSSSFLMEVATGFVIFIFNIQILKYIGDNGIVVYGIISNCILVGASLFNGVAQASQPIIATNHGASEVKRVKNIVKYALYTTIGMGIILYAVVFIFTKEVILVFVKADNTIINMGIPAIRMYLSAFCIMNINILMCNYFQSVGKEKLSVTISVIRGFLLNIILVFIMPFVLGGNSLWLVVPITEIITFIGIDIYLVKRVKENKVGYESYNHKKIS